MFTKFLGAPRGLIVWEPLVLHLKVHTVCYSTAYHVINHCKMLEILTKIFPCKSKVTSSLPFKKVVVLGTCFLQVIKLQLKNLQLSMLELMVNAGVLF